MVGHLRLLVLEMRTGEDENKMKDIMIISPYKYFVK